jgi:omega-6 fatty acid desaturase (delta-12 desaturase)
MSEAIATFPRSGKELFDATRPFAAEVVATSWWHFLSTLTLVLAALTGAALAPVWPLRLALSLAGALLMARLFILYHDHLHGAILAESRLARAMFTVYGWFALTPARSWRFSHNFHHGHMGKLEGSEVGSFPLMTAERWRRSSRGARFAYRFSRHPATVLLGYVTIFFFSITLLAFLRQPRQRLDSLAAILAHGGLLAALFWYGGWDVAFFGLLLPMGVASAVGGYLFYAQHTSPGLRILPEGEWNFYDAPLVSASYLRMGPVMRWLTGNIGFHHVHHLNPRIPFYRLPEAMAAIPELQHPVVTTLRPRDIRRCFHLNLWDPASDRMVGYREAASAA